MTFWYHEQEVTGPAIWRSSWTVRRDNECPDAHLPPVSLRYAATPKGPVSVQKTRTSKSDGSEKFGRNYSTVTAAEWHRF